MSHCPCSMERPYLDEWDCRQSNRDLTTHPSAFRKFKKQELHLSYVAGRDGLVVTAVHRRSSTAVGISLQTAIPSW